MKNLSPLLVAVLLFGCTSTVQPTAGQAVSKVVAAAVQKNLDVSPVVECAIRAAFLTPPAILAHYGFIKAEKAEKRIAQIQGRAQLEQRGMTAEEEAEIRRVRVQEHFAHALGFVGFIGVIGSSMFADAQFDPITSDHWWARCLAIIPAGILKFGSAAILKKIPATANLGPWSEHAKEIGLKIGTVAFGRHIERRYIDPRFRAVRPISGKEKILRIVSDVLPFSIAETLF